MFITNIYSYLKQPHSLYQVSFHPLRIKTKCTLRFHIISLYIDLGLGSDGLALKQLNAVISDILANIVNSVIIRTSFFISHSLMCKIKVRN